MLASGGSLSVVSGGGGSSNDNKKTALQESSAFVSAATCHGDGGGTGADEAYPPMFLRSELSFGKFLGRGAFSDVIEIVRINVASEYGRGADESDGGGDQGCIVRSDALAPAACEESRKFIAMHCIRSSGDARYAVKVPRDDIVDNSDNHGDQGNNTSKLRSHRQKQPAGTADSDALSVSTSPRLVRSQHELKSSRRCGKDLVGNHHSNTSDRSTSETAEAADTLQSSNLRHQPNDKSKNGNHQSRNGKNHGPTCYSIVLMDLKAEAGVLKQLEHPNIIKLRGISSSFGTGDVDANAAGECGQRVGAHFIVLDRLNDTLRDRLQSWKDKHRRVPLWKDLRGHFRQYLLEKRLEAAYNLSTAIYYLHEDRRICHRDIKPENIGFDIRGDIKLFDFGFAKQLPWNIEGGEEEDDDGTYHLTGPIGSYRYMAPEVAKGEKYNEKCDVYSFCIMLWEMIFLHRPYAECKTHEQLSRRVFRNGHRPPLSRAPAVPVAPLPGQTGASKRALTEMRETLRNGWDQDVARRSDIAEVMSSLRCALMELRRGDDRGLDYRNHLLHRRSTFVFRNGETFRESLETTP